MKGYKFVEGFAEGLLWAVSDGKEESIIDWHGKVIVRDIYDVRWSDSCKYMLVWTDKNEIPNIYSIEK